MWPGSGLIARNLTELPVCQGTRLSSLAAAMLCGPSVAATLVRDRFGDEIDAVRTAFNDLRANFAFNDAQGSRAYVQQMLIDDPDRDPATLAADAVLAVEEFYRGLQH